MKGSTYMSEKLILASASPRRKEILNTAGYSYEIIPSNASEMTDGLNADELVMKNALAKALDVYSRVGKEDVVLGADTVVCLNGKILGKPESESDAFTMLKSLSNRGHEVLTGYAVVGKTGNECGVCATKVKFKALTDDEIWAYIKTNEPMDKAGAYGIQERACIFAESFEGDFFNIIGLPIARIYPLLSEFGILPDWQRK